MLVPAEVHLHVVFQAELVQPPSMMEKQMKSSKAKAAIKGKETPESPTKEASPVPEPAQSLQGEILFED